MDKRVIFAVAGSGKTTYIVNQLTVNENSLVITYTNTNLKVLRNAIIHKFGFFPNNIHLFSYFSFIYTFCFKPFFLWKYRAHGISFERNPNKRVRLSNTRLYFFDNYFRIFSNRIAKFLETQNSINEINTRISKFYTKLYIDEVQDLAGNDFNFLKDLSKANIDILLVGDFFQHTFDTSRDGNVNKNLHTNFNNYKNQFKSMGYFVDEQSLMKSHRCSPKICQFITEKIGIEMYSERIDDTEMILIEDRDEAMKIINNDDIIKLFYSEHYKHNCFSRNWGDSKGIDTYQDVCVVLYKKAFLLFKDNKLFTLPPSSRNKLYVACSRTRNNLYIVSSDLCEI